MSNLFFSSHAQRRINLRGLSLKDIELIQDYGAEVEGGFLLTEKNVREAVLRLKSQILRLEHLSGKRVVCDGNTIITAYHATDNKIRRILRRSAEQN